MGAVETLDQVSPQKGYFRFGGAVCYGQLGGRSPSNRVAEASHDVVEDAVFEDGRLRLPFDLAEVVTNLRRERYPQSVRGVMETLTTGNAARAFYYFVRPFLTVSVRKHLQKVRLRGWDKIPFPRWPLDTSVDALMQSALGCIVEGRGGAKVPFIWFWPDGAPACAMMTHDVEGAAGLAFCSALAAIDDSFGIKSAFQLVPEGREEETAAALRMLRGRGFEVNIHDLNHDGHLFHNRPEFLKRAAEINAYARRFQCGGFRSAAMYREQDWYDAFEFSYDMSVPNAAHLEPQRGGCCTVMPYFVGKLLELPLTTTQDYSLFHIIGDYSTALWEKQAELIMAQHGLISFIAHPDYLVEPRACGVYRDLLAYLSRLRESRGVWTAMPAQVDRWWRDRQSMSLVRDGETWRVDGPGSERARVAYAVLENGRLTYELQDGAPVSTAAPQ